MTSNTDAVATFRAEADELLERIELGLLDLSRKPGDRALVDDVFRSLHTLKGSGAMFGFDALASFTHHCESAFDRVRKGEVTATENLVSVVLAAQDHMRSLLEGAETINEATGQELLMRLEQEVKMAGDAPPPEEPRKTSWEISFALPPNALVNGCNPMALLTEMRDLGECSVAADISEIPALDALVANECYVTWNVKLLTAKSRTDIEDVFMFIIDDMKLDIRQVETDKASEPAQPKISGDAAPSSDVSQTDKQRPASAPDARQAAKSSESVRVPAERLDELMDRVGELVIAQSRLSQIAAASPDLNLRAVAEDIERLSNELRDTMMVLRMVPVGTLFGRFRRLVHDLARETGKTIDLTTEGEGTEVDKTVIERLADPLVHLVRNSVDHGLETPERRKAAGKPEAGKINLAARHAGGEVVISITDDGAGIDRARVRAKAEAQGLIIPGANIGDQDLLQMIFQPGFSTAQAVTNLSGRGVGMDVVKRTVEALRGSIDLSSEPGAGSRVSLRIPLTLAIIDGLLVRVGTGRYVIPLSAVEECLELPVEQDLRSRGRSFISLRDTLVPFIRLREIFQTATQPDQFQKIVVVSTGAERVGLVVDQIIGDHQTVIKAMSKLHEDVAMFSGATILGDGSVALILDIAHLVATGQMNEALLRKAG
ncbi:MAG: chemotaxis protein CheA [Proteobacteria bacterium]|nr:chemotaxis protein CheA [Pseudomonadota bacterium]